MAHIQIRIGDGGSPALKIVVDGVDLSNHVYTEGFGLVRVGEDDYAEWGLSMIVPIESLDIDLPDAVVKALAASGSEFPEATPA